MLRVAFILLGFAGFGLGATPGTLVAPGVVEVTLKDGKPLNISCPPLFETNVGNFFQPGDYDGMKAACLKADFDTNEGCDACLTAFVEAAFSKDRFSGTDEQRQSKGTFKDIPFALIPQINFSNGCPFAQACKSALIKTVEDDTEDAALGKAFGVMIDKCTGSNPGPDYMSAFKFVENIQKAANISLPSMEAAAPVSSAVQETVQDTSATTPVASGAVLERITASLFAALIIAIAL